MFVNKIKIGKRLLSNNSKTYVIAEAGVAHLGNFDLAKKLVDIAVESKADAVKFQAYITDELIDRKYLSWYKKYKIKEVDFNFLKKIKKYCDKKKIEFLCTPHSNSAIEWIEKLKVKAIKVGSGELGNFQFLNKICNLNLPVIISLGMHNKEDIKRLKKFLKNKKNKKIIFLNCCTSYPANPAQINLNKIHYIKKIFNNALVGYSDHTNDDVAILSSVLMGAKIVEKHISVIFNDKKTQDWKVSFDKNDFSKMIDRIRSLEKMLNNSNFIGKTEERQKIWATRSIFSNNYIKKHTKVKQKDLYFLRPGNGIRVSKYKSLLGKISKINIKNKTKLKINMFK